MATIQDLPRGKQFSPKKWDSKFKASTSSGDLSVLSDNQAALSEIAKKRQSAIRRSSYDSGSRKADYQEILKIDQNLTNRDKKYVREILDHWASKSKEESKLTPVRSNEKKPPRSDYGRPLPSFLQNSAVYKAKTRSNTPYSAGSDSSMSRPNSLYRSNSGSNSLSSTGGVNKPTSSPRNLPRLSV